MKDHLEKYLAVSKDFANKAGWLMQNYEQQIRLCDKLSRQKMSEDGKKLILSCIESQKTASDLCNFVKGFLQKIMSDSEHLIEGAKMKNIIEEQSEIINFFLNDTTREGKKTA